MRAIDTMSPAEIETLRVKGMLPEHDKMQGEPTPPDRVFYVDEYQYDALCNLQAARCALNGHRDKPTIQLADKYIAQAMEALRNAASNLDKMESNAATN